MLGLAIMMASRWNRPSATNTMAAVPGASTGAVHPRTSPGDRGRLWGTLSEGKSASSASLAACGYQVGGWVPRVCELIKFGFHYEN